MCFFVRSPTCQKAHNPLGSQATCPEPRYPGYRMKLLLFWQPSLQARVDGCKLTSCVPQPGRGLVTWLWDQA